MQYHNVIQHDELNMSGLEYLAGAPGGVVLSDRSGNIRWCNRAAAAIFGYDVTELQGQKIEILLPPEYRGQHQHQRADFYAEPRTRLMGERQHIAGLHRSGREIPLLVGLSQVMVDGEALIISHIVDYSRQIELEDDLRLMQQLSVQVGEAVDFDTAVQRVLIKVSTHIDAVYADSWLPQPDAKQMRRHLCWIDDERAPEEFRDTAVTITLQEWDDEDPIWMTTEKDVMVVAVPVRSQDGQDIALLSFYLENPPQSSARVTNLISFISLQLGNLLQRKQDAQRLLQYAAELEASNQQLETANRELETFAIFVSHDLRTPLRAINGYSQLLLSDYNRLLPEEGQEFLQYIRESTLRMDALIEGLLSYARLGRQTKPEKSMVDVELIVRELIHELQFTVEATFTVSFAASSIWGNELLLRQIFSNLIGNAVKYHEPGNQPEVAVRGRVTDDAWIFEVQDNGIGIAPEHHSKVFETLKRLHTSEEYEGSGIGLAITRRCVLLLGGEITLESASGAGSTFAFTVPRP